MKRLGVIFCLCMLLSGCNPNGNVQHSCTMSLDTLNMTGDARIMLFGTKEHVDKAIVTITLDTHLLGEGFAEDVYRELVWTFDQMNEVEGFTIDITLNGNVITEKETIDFNTMSQANRDLFGYPIQKNVTMEEAMKNYEASGFTCY